MNRGTIHRKYMKSEEETAIDFKHDINFLNIQNRGIMEVRMNLKSHNM